MWECVVITNSRGTFVTARSHVCLGAVPLLTHSNYALQHLQKKQAISIVFVDFVAHWGLTSVSTLLTSHKNTFNF